MASLNTTQSVIEYDAVQPSLPAPFSYDTFKILDVCIFMVSTGAFATFGVVSNIINIIVFYRQGILSSSTNVNLSGLAFSDFFICLTMLMRAMCLWFKTFTTEHGYYPWTAYSLAVVVSNQPEIGLQMTCWITAVTAFERVISVMFPFKVKSLFTARRALVVILAIIVIVFVLNSPMALRHYLTLELNTATNTSYLLRHFTHLFSPELYSLFVVITSVLKLSSIGIVLICNVILFWQVSLSQKFRKTASAGTSISAGTKTEGKGGNEKETDAGDAGDKGDKGDKKSNPSSSTKETKLLRMITVISLVFTICNAWEMPLTVLYNYVWVQGVHFHIYSYYLWWTVSCLTGVINSSTNIIIYYTMSSRYKETFNALFNIK